MNRVTGTIDNLQILRAFAAINVVIFHIIGTSIDYGFEPNQLSLLEGWGANGVDVFFVLSGFVMLHSQFQKKRSAWDFFKFRLIRIIPIYWFVTMVVVASYLLIPSSSFNSVMPSIERILQSLFFLSQAISGNSPILSVGWTLEWEMLFYSIFSLSLVFSQWNKSYLFMVLFFILTVIITSEFIILEFLYGMLIAYVFNRYKIGPKKGFIIAVIGFVFLLCSINQVDSEHFYRVVYWGLPSFLIIFGLVYANQYKSPFLKYLGDASYSIYLVHIIFISIYYKVVTFITIPLNNDFLALLCLVGSILCGVVLYRFFEKPLTLFVKSTF
ncbi:acyltransferase [Pseudomonadales bacterium]|nr:acyltransferase [Pseudomonadales bacterium]